MKLQISLRSFLEISVVVAILAAWWHLESRREETAMTRGLALEEVLLEIDGVADASVSESSGRPTIMVRIENNGPDLKNAFSKVQRMGRGTWPNGDAFVIKGDRIAYGTFQGSAQEVHLR